MQHKPHTLTWTLLVMLVITGVVFGIAAQWINRDVEESSVRYGITFSTKYAKELGINPKSAYLAFIDEMNVKYVRLPVYWPYVVPKQGVEDWELLDWLVVQSERSGVKLTLVVGEKVPRWPECFVPEWVTMLERGKQNDELNKFIGTVIDRYKDSTAVERWQVENEPFFPFGECEHTITQEEFAQRVATVRAHDSARPIQVTVSGELSPWDFISEQADILGISMYRKTWNDLFGHFIYPIPSEFYYFRAKLIEDDVERVIVSELQAEPWFPEPIENRSFVEWAKLFTPEQFEENIEFARESRLPEAYLWGAEWWYILKLNGDEGLWNVAKNIF